MRHRSILGKYVGAYFVFGLAIVMQQGRANELFSENFESVTLMPIVTFESELREREAWQTTNNAPRTNFPSQTPGGPSGWTELNNTTSVGDTENGVLEFEGWRFVNKDWWVNTAGGQGREQFLNGTGIVAIADPDEWDDFGSPTADETTLDPADGVFDSTLKTPTISLATVGPTDTVNLSFSSSWRDEDVQTATLTAVYNNDSVVLHNWTSQAADADFKNDAQNENLLYELAIPNGATSVQFEFRLQGNNDWWWAIDNLRVYTGEGVGTDGVLRTLIDRDSGEVTILNNTGQDIDLRGYSIVSVAGAFNEEEADFLSVSDTNWIQATQVGGTTNDLSELHLTSYLLAAGGEINLGTDVWAKYFRESSDISFNYLVAGSNDQIPGIVEFTGNLVEGVEQPFAPLDLNFDATVDILDWETFKAGFGTDLTGLTQAKSYALGDLDGDNLHTLRDFLEFQRLYDLANGPGALAAAQSGTTVPEPSSWLLLGGAGLGLLWSRRKAAAKSVLSIALFAITLIMAQNASAQLVLLDEDFDDAPNLQPWVEETGSNKTGNVWTHTLPGWTTDNSGVPGVGIPDIPGVSEAQGDDPLTDEDSNGVLEWSNWAFVDKEAWIAADDQGRSAFEFGSGNVMVADSDEWDDQDGALRNPLAQNPTPDDLYDVFARTPVINIPAGVPNGRIKLAFDSSWRGDEFQDDLDGDNNQRATITAIYNGATQKQVLTWDSDPDSNNLNPNAENQRILELDLQYAGESTLQLEFAMTDAWNDWWWAIDNVVISVPTDPTKLRINTATGRAYIEGDDVIPSSITGINIYSPSGQLLPITGGGLAAAISDVVDGPDLGTTAGDSPGEQWERLTSTTKQFTEAFLFGDLTGGTQFDNLRSELLGVLQDASLLDDDPMVALANSDLAFAYSLASGAIVDGVVEYYFELPPNLFGDFNLNGVVDAADYTVWRDNFGQPGDAGLNGNGDGLGVVDFGDYVVWRSNFGATAAALNGDVSAVPEPGTISIGVVTVTLLILSRFRGSLRKGALAGALLLPVFLCQVSWAQPAPYVDRFYRFGDDDAGVVVGQPITQTDNLGNVVTFDSAGMPGMNQLIDLVSKGRFNLQPVYADTTDRPDGNGGIGLYLNNDNFDRQYLRTGFGEGLNYPEQSPSSIASILNPGGTLNYYRLNDRGFELWVKPKNVAAGEQHIVMDTQQHGVFIDSAGHFAMRYASQYEVTTEQLPGPDMILGTPDDILTTGEPVVTPANYVTEVTAVNDQWYHLAVVRPSGPGNGSILYINGVAEAIGFGSYAVERIVNLGEGDVFTNISALDQSPLYIGARTDPLTLDRNVDSGTPQSDFYFRGIVDDLEMFVMGLNDDDNLPGGGNNQLNDWGEYIFQLDNDYAAAFAPVKDGDLTNDGMITLADASVFASNWLFENRLSAIDPVTELELSRLVGDLSTRMLGDFDYNGIIDLEDWAILNDANPLAGATALRMIANGGVPEPSTLGLMALGVVAFGMHRRRKRERCHNNSASA